MRQLREAGEGVRVRREERAELRHRGHEAIKVGLAKRERVFVNGQGAKGQPAGQGARGERQACSSARSFHLAREAARGAAEATYCTGSWGTRCGSKGTARWLL